MIELRTREEHVLKFVESARTSVVVLF